MKTFTSLSEFDKPKNGCVLAIGNFDGIHIGHQSIIARAGELAGQYRLPLVGMTFDPAAIKVLRPELAPRILTPSNVKSCLLEALGLDQLIVIQTTCDFLAQSPGEFIEHIMVNRLNAIHLVEGESFAFGHRRQGSVEMLGELAKRFGFEVHLVPSKSLVPDDRSGPVVVSSTFIRQQITACRFDQVRRCLGRFYEIAGRVVPGHGRGHKIGFPTANLRLYAPDQLVPPDGVYGAYVRVGDSTQQVCGSPRSIPAAVSIGSCETFSDGNWQIEAHLLDFDAPLDSLYDKHMFIAIVDRIRQQEKFKSAEDLIDAITDDCRKVRLALLSQGTDT